GLVPALADAGAELLLVGRDLEKLRRRFPGKACCGYDDIPSHAQDYDLLVHLAVVNNNADCAADVFRDINVHLLMDTVERAKEASIGVFINVSSIHALDPRNRTPYAMSKREVVEELRGVRNIDVRTIYLPAIRANGWSGNLSVLNHLPTRIAHCLFDILRAYKPTVDIKKLVEYVLSVPDCTGDVILTTGQKSNVVYVSFKRAVDLAFALFVSIFFWWLLLAVWI